MLGVVWGCGYHHYTGPLRPALEQPNRTRAEAGGVIFAQGHLRVEVRALTDTELNRQFQSRSVAGPQSTNPYTFADTRFWEGDKHRSRFTTFSLRVVNEDFPKVKIDPSRVSLQAVDGSEYWSLELQQLDTYYRAYAVGFRGNEYARYQERLDLLRSTLFKNEEIFAGQEAEGYVVFPALHHDVSEVEVAIHDAVLRFDHRNEPVETVQIHCRFKRDIGKIYRDGRLVLEASS
jgi:hypothetical protein